MKDIARWVLLGALFLIPFLPLYVESSLFFPFITGKGFAFRILVEIAVGAFATLALLDKRYRPQWSWTLLIYGALVAWMFVADLLGANPHKAFWSNYERMDGFVTMAHAFLFFVVAGTALTVEKKWRAWLLTALAASALVICHGLLQLMCAGAACAKTFAIHQGGVRVDANMGNAAYLAAYLLFMIAIALWQALQSKGWLRYGLLVLAGLQFVVLYATATRGALLGFVGATGLALALWAFMSGGTARKVSAAALAGLALLIGGFFALKDTSFVRNDPTLSRIASISLADGATRLTLWSMAWEGVKQDPITGWGHEGYNFIFNEQYRPSLYAQETWFDRAHNSYIDWLVAGGIPAFFLFIALLLSGALALLRSSLPRSERILLVAALAAYSFQALFVFDNLMTYIMLAAVLALAHAGSFRPFARLEALPEAGAKNATVAASVIAVVTLAAVWFVNVPSIVGGQELIKGIRAGSDLSVNVAHFEKALSSGTFAVQEVREQFIGFASQVARMGNIPEAARAATLARAFEEIQKEVNASPNDARLRLMLAQGYEAAGDLQGSLREIEAALALSPKKQAIIIQRGIELWKLGDKPAALAAFKDAYALDPSFGEVAVYVAAGEIVNGRSADGEGLLAEHFGTAVVDRDILRFAYFEAKDYGGLIDIARAKAAALGGAPAARFELAQALALAGRSAEARAEIQAVIAEHPETAAQGAKLLADLGLAR
jgi:O-antigen ligase/thioredoxin-like negative regulator of GroEL